MVHINTDFYQKTNAEVITDTERVIAGYMKAIADENCSEAIRYDSREEVKYHLGEERKTTVSWYPFKKDACILEVGAEFGAITGELCNKAKKVVVTETSYFKAYSISERYKKRENLEVYAGEVNDIQFTDIFDYIIIVNAVSKIGKNTTADNYYIDSLSHLTKYLHKDGKIIFIEDNLYSIFRCQDPNGSFNPWMHIQKLHKKQIEQIMQKAGFPYIKFYYPLPTYEVVGRVYTDSMLPTAPEWNFLIHNNEAAVDSNQLASSMDLFQKLTDNNMFAFFAPSYFVEAGREDNLSVLEKANVLFDETFEVPLLGFDWRQKGYGSLTQAIAEYRDKKIQPYKQLELKAKVLQIDQDKEVLARVQEISLNLLKKLQSVCQKHNLKLYAMYGTLLGCVRNAGIILGDDDIDVALMREDYNKLLTLQHEFADEYFLQTPENDNCFYGGYLKLRNRNTAEMHPKNWWVDCCEGISIDIFPIDNGFLDVKKEQKKQKKITVIQRLLYAKAYGFFPNFKDMKLLEWKAYKYIGKLFSRKQLSGKLMKLMSDGDNMENAPFGIYAHYLGNGKPRLLDRKAFEKEIQLPYEDMLLSVPGDWDGVLKSLYGESYMIPYPWEEGKIRHGFYNPQMSYQVYKRRFRDLFRPMPEANQKIALFGDGYVFQLYFERYKEEKYKPEYIVALYGENVTKKVCGITMQSMEEISSIDKKELYPVICSVDIRAAEEKMKQAGFEDYFIFLGSREWMLYANPTVILNGINMF